ncbi:2-hydroxyacyl-CoA dehydratase family protein [Sporomusa acidovorans]|uniref:2-hydroxyglutaryl-CoA dehydratase, D-component n=1 Tax=Sporomusa acidovorans (strain ATCC 49682 / DSM 3132 / Mol) TaxID=1123286 RepID=A0ABZ3J018_SPOA4|nr:2-hydroxyacyl-CoA dehydratase [Sporomusa acidovorans]OZC21351.1 2-hydroxyglutaryl-CoA dehydratase, D-component [Sporomusa acidovorans DSM 3132]SDE56599.1 Benzoyl-CoA reductase/2-hydroxyglutaryl-CoA dehydratase subunit, BcrC/BadD/HgdB [Sporomusa acidovorans]
MARIGLTTTVPVEIILAAGHVPVDLNNIFITSEQAGRMVETAEEAGYPRNICGWIKGLYAVMVNKEFNDACGGIDKVIAVTQGDCSNTHALMETYQLAGIETIPFAYPVDRDYDLLKLQMEKLMAALGTNWQDVNRVKRELDKLRLRVAELDRRTWQDNTISGFHNHLYQVSCSDFNSNVELFAGDVEQFLVKADDASEYTDELRLGYIGVPPIFTDLYPYVESMGARIVYNEVQRQFAMPFVTDDLVEQYRLYTYPYGVFGRIKDIAAEIERRNLDGLVHYVQSFCFRQIEDIILREKLDIPILTIEGDKPGKLDARTRLRLESFLEMLR